MRGNLAGLTSGVPKSGILRTQFRVILKMTFFYLYSCLLKLHFLPGLQHMKKSISRVGFSVYHRSKHPSKLALPSCYHILIVA